MAIVKMLKIRLMGLNSQKQKILNTLYKTGGVELSETKEYSDTFRVLTESNIIDLGAKCDRLEKAVAFYDDTIKQCKKYDFYPADFNENDTVFVSLDDFLSVGKKEKEIFDSVELSERYSARLAEIKEWKKQHKKD